MGSSTGAANEASKNSVSAGLRFQKTRMEHWSMDRIQRFTQKLYGFECYGVSDLGIYDFGVSRDTHFISVYKLAANVTSKLLRPRCVTQVGQQLRSGWHHILPYIHHISHINCIILAMLTICCQQFTRKCSPYQT